MDPIIVGESLEIKYAKGFEIRTLKNAPGYQLLLKSPWPGSATQNVFYLLPSTTTPSTVESVITTPVQNLVATSTTHIPPLVLLGDQDKLIGFPDTDYISAAAVRDLINKGSVEDLGANESINIERTIALQPNVVMGYAIDGNNPSLDQIQRAGIPIIYNADWTEQHPLGRAEWIKVFGILLGKEKESFQIFNQIEADYLEAKAIATQFEKPVVMAGAAWKNVWYMPYGDSWQGQLIADAGGDYVYNNTSGSGSLAYDIETVLQSSQQADYWIAPGQYTSYDKMLADHSSYSLFHAFEKMKVYTFALNTGAAGGVLYYEEASMRPDLVLKDLVKILHPTSIDHELYFFDPLAP